jgi:hypothetical protein
MTRWIASVIVLLALVPIARAQQDSPDKPLGDAAREQRDIHKQAKPEKVYDNKDVAPAASPDSSDAKASEVPEAASTTTPPAKIPQSISPDQVVLKGNSQASQSALDRPKDKEAEEADDVLVVLAGTQVKVDVSEAKVVVPVRVGFSTAIPALSKATVLISGRYYDAGYANVAELTAVTVGGSKYNVHTDQIPIPNPGALLPSEVTFTLLDSLTIKH